VTFNVGVIVTIGVVLLGYLVSGLLAWGKLTTTFDTIKEAQGKMVTTDSLRAALAEMELRLMKKPDDR
jgi:cytochrome c-type biogenesis protein CcmH/NrfG